MLRQVCLGMLAVVLVSGMTQAGVATVYTDADAYVYFGYTSGAHKDKNYGGSTSLGTGSPYYNDNYMKNYLHFDLGGYGAVASATLKLGHISGTAVKTRNIEIFAIMDDAKEWDPTALPQGVGTGQDTAAHDITWENAPQCRTAGSSYMSSFVEEGAGFSAITRKIGDIPGSGGVDIVLDVTDLVNWLVGANSTYSSFADANDQLTICFISQYGSGYPIPSWNWASTEHSTAVAPLIELEEVPPIAEPAGLGLIGLALLGLKRRRS
jgi:MYXO-CTERM domain-containing protein